MAGKEWTAYLEDGVHNIRLEKKLFATKWKIRLDDRVLEDGVKTTTAPIGNAEYSFPIADHSGQVVIRSNGFKTTYDLFVDGMSTTTGEPYSPLAPIPIWGWVFVVACGAIPIISGGGIVPTLFGVAGVAVCLSQLRNASRSTASRVLICLGATVLSWILFLAFAIWIASYQF